MSRRVRAVLMVAYAGYLVCVGLLVWSPEPSAPGSVIELVTDLGVVLGMDVSPRMVEFGLNVVMLVPLSLLGGLLFSGLTVLDWPLVGLATSVLIEGGQRLFLPSRDPAIHDVVANTLGAMLGAVLLVAVARRSPDRMTP